MSPDVVTRSVRHNQKDSPRRSTYSSKNFSPFMPPLQRFGSVPSLPSPTTGQRVSSSIEDGEAAPTTPRPHTKIEPARPLQQAQQNMIEAAVGTDKVADEETKEASTSTDTNNQDSPTSTAPSVRILRRHGSFRDVDSATTTPLPLVTFTPSGMKRALPGQPYYHPASCGLEAHTADSAPIQRSARVNRRSLDDPFVRPQHSNSTGGQHAYTGNQPLYHPEYFMALPPPPPAIWTADGVVDQTPGMRNQQSATFRMPNYSAPAGYQSAGMNAYTTPSSNAYTSSSASSFFYSPNTLQPAHSW